MKCKKEKEMIIMQKKVFKSIVTVLTGITLGSSVIGSGVSVVSASEMSHSSVESNIETVSEPRHSYLKMMNDTLLQAGFSQSDIDRASFSDKQVVYKALVEKSEKGRFVREVTRVLKRAGGSLGRFAKRVGVLAIISHIVRAWDAYDGEPSRILYHVFRMFGASRTTAHRWTRVIMSQI